MPVICVINYSLKAVILRDIKAHIMENILMSVMCVISHLVTKPLKRHKCFQSGECESLMR
jgi:hypothetical protein